MFLSAIITISLKAEKNVFFFLNAYVRVDKRLSLSMSGWTDEKQRNERHNVRFTFSGGNK